MRVIVERLFHLVGPRFEGGEQIAVPALEVLKHIGELLRGDDVIERQNAVDDVVGPRLVGRTEILRLDRRLEWPDDDARRIRSEIEGLPI